MTGVLTRPEFLATTEWLAERLGRPELRIVDVRCRPDGTSRQVYQSRHLPSAVFLDWRTTLVEADGNDRVLALAGPERLATALGQLGVGDGTTVVAYDDTDSLYAARTWWSLRAYGFESVRVLDGGYRAWADEGRELSMAELPITQASFTPRAQPRMRLTTLEVRSLLGALGVTILDARPPAEYLGQSGSGRRLGHIPGAINVPAASLSDPGSQRLRPAAELHDLLRRANVPPTDRLVCYDGTGIRAAKLAFVLALLGFDDVTLYDGGWSEWGDRLELPIER